MNGPWWLPERLDTLYGAIAGGLIAFLSAFLTNRHALKRQKLDLAHQAEQKEKERLHAMKRDIYLPYLGALGSAVSFVARIATVPFENLTVETPLDELGKQVAKISLVAPPEVVEPVDRGHAGLRKISAVLISERQVIQELDGNLKILDASLENLSTEVKANLATFQRREEHKMIDKALAQQFAEYHAHLGQQRLKLQEERLALMKQRADLELRLNRLAVKEIRPLRAHGEAALLAMRRDLGMQTDEKRWAQLLSLNVIETDAALDRFYDDVERRNRERFAHIQAVESPAALEAGEQKPPGAVPT